MKSLLIFASLCVVLISSCSSQKSTGAQKSESGAVKSTANNELRVEIPVPRTPEQALEDFYTYLNTGKYAEAYFLWEDSGKASGYDYPRFEKGYKSLSSSKYTITGEKILRNTLGIVSVEIPVEVTLSKKDGENISYTGSYTLIQNGSGAVLTAQNSYWLMFRSSLKAKE